MIVALLENKFYTAPTALHCSHCFHCLQRHLDSGQIKVSAVEVQINLWKKVPAPVCLQCETGVAIFQVDSSTPPVFLRPGKYKFAWSTQYCQDMWEKDSGTWMWWGQRESRGLQHDQASQKLHFAITFFWGFLHPLENIFWQSSWFCVFLFFWRDPCSNTRLKSTRKFYWYSQFVCVLCKVSILIVPPRGSVSKTDWGECVCKEPSLPSGEIPSHPSHTATESHATLWGFLRKSLLQVKDPSTLLAILL